MKKEIHPKLNPVLFVDTSCGAEFMTLSTLSGEGTKEKNGISYGIINVEISSASHPFYTGEHRFVDTAGRVDKFKEKMERVKSVSGAKKGKKVRRTERAEKKAPKVLTEKEAAKLESK